MANSPPASNATAVFVALIAAAAGFGGAWLTFASKSQELQIRMVEIAVGILRADPKGPGSDWAIRVIELNSGTTFSAVDRKELMKNPMVLANGAPEKHIYGK